jgi:hypothetical protein
MKTKIKLTALAVLSAIWHQPSPLLAQGSLTPPGMPMPTMKTLDQIEARTPISSAPYTINQPGSYYLASNINVSSGNAITIAANGVTLDLNGFTISSTEATPTGTGILLAGAVTDIIIRNGHIKGQVAYSAGNYVGSGFANGIEESGSPPVNVRVTGVTVSGCLDDGIAIGSVNSTIVESCNVLTVGGYGIEASSVFHSTAKTCGNVAISADTASDSFGNCTGGGDGIDATIVANNCTGSSINGIGVNVATANSCSGSSVNSDGIDATTAQNCSGVALGSGIGVSASYTAENCYGNSASGDGIDAQTVLNSYGVGLGYGIFADSAQNSRGTTTAAGNGVFAVIAQNCRGISNGSGTGLFGTTAQNCYGNSTSGDGLHAGNAQNCFGSAASSGTGLLVYDAAVGCYGDSDSGTGLSTTIAIGCYGYSNSGTGLSAYIGNSCVGSSLSVTKPFNM